MYGRKGVSKYQIIYFILVVMASLYLSMTSFAEILQTYIVKPTDTSCPITWHVGPNIQTIAELNHLGGPNLISTGQKLMVPGSHKVVQGLTLSPLQPVANRIWNCTAIEPLEWANPLFYGAIDNRIDSQVNMANAASLLTVMPTGMVAEATPVGEVVTGEQIVLADTGTDEKGQSGESGIVLKESKETQELSTIELLVGGGELVVVEGIKRVATSNPAVADVAVISDNQLLINGKGVGEAILYIWYKKGLKSYRVTVQAYKSDIVARISEAIKLPRVSVKLINDSVLLEGKVNTQEEARRAELIASTYVKKVVNLIEVGKPGEPSAMVLKVAEIKEAINLPQVSVKLINGSVLLEGKVNTQEEARRAALIAGAYIKEVVNLIEVYKPEEPSPTALKIAEIKGAIGLDSVFIRMSGETAIIEGTVPTLIDAQRVKTIVQAYAKQIVDFLKIANPIQIKVKAKVAEIDRTALRELGVRWGGISEAEKAVVFTPETFMFGQLEKGGPLESRDLLGAQLRALEQKGKARMMAEPNLLVRSGETANILIGGEIPLPMSTALGTVSVLWRDFGVKLEVSPVLVDEETVEMKVKPEVSSLDWENAVTIGSIRIPALKKRSADTVVQVKDRNTLVIGGLIQETETKQIKKVPLLGDIPVLGQLFRSTQYQKGETELVIFVTPEIVRVTPETE